MLLAIESATELVGVALLEGGEVRYEASRTGRRQHAETLAPLVDEALRSVEARPSDLEAVAVDVGPGLFTGLRVGVAMAKGLAFAARIGVVPVVSLEALADAALTGGPSDTVLSVVDARRGEVFAGRFARGRADGRPEALDQPRRYRPEELEASLATLVPSGGDLALVGDGALRYGGDWRLPRGASLGGADLAAPPPRSVGHVAAAIVSSGELPRDPATVEAMYLRDADARINWATRAGAPAAGAG